MSLVQNNPLFAGISREFAVRYVDLMARILHQEELVNFDLANITPDADYLLGNICFAGSLNFEEQSGFDGDGKTYTPRVAFETDEGGPHPTVLIGDTQVHGLFEDDVIKEGIERAQKKEFGG